MGGGVEHTIMGWGPYQKSGKRSPCTALLGEVVYVQGHAIKLYDDAWQVGPVGNCFHRCLMYVQFMRAGIANIIGSSSGRDWTVEIINMCSGVDVTSVGGPELY